MRRIAITIALFALPFLVLAQVPPGPQFGQIGTYIQNIIGFINGYLVPLVFAFAFLMFIWGIFQYFILGGADEGKRETGRQLMIWGVIAFVIMVSVWGVVNVLSSGLGFRSSTLEGVPVTPGAGVKAR